MAFSPGVDDLIPAFALSVFNESDAAVTLNVHLPAKPDIKKHASLGLVYGLAIMLLDRQGVLETLIEQLLADGPINEIDACNRISMLLDKDANELPA